MSDDRRRGVEDVLAVVNRDALLRLLERNRDRVQGRRIRIEIDCDIDRDGAWVLGGIVLTGIMPTRLRAADVLEVGDPQPLASLLPSEPRGLLPPPPWPPTPRIR